MAASKRTRTLAPAAASQAGAQPACLLHVRLVDLGRLDGELERWRDLCRHASGLGLNGMLVEALWQRAGERAQAAGLAGGAGPALPGDAAPADADVSAAVLGAQPMAPMLQSLARAAREQGLDLYLDVVLDRAAAHAVPRTAQPHWLQPHADDPARDPRLAHTQAQVLPVRPGPLPEDFLQAWQGRLAAWLQAGVRGLCFDAPQRFAASDWRALLAPLRAGHGQARFLAWTHGLTPEAVAGLAGAGLDAVFSSLPWWDLRADWLAHEDHRLRAVAPVIAPMALAGGEQASDRRALWAAALSGDGLLLPSTLLLPQQEIAQAVEFVKQSPPRTGLRLAPGAQGWATVLVRRQAAGTAMQEAADLILINPDAHAPAQVDLQALAGLLPPGARTVVDDGAAPAGTAPDAPLPPGGYRRLRIAGHEPVRASAYSPFKRAPALRVAIEQVQPAVDDGQLPAKALAGRPVAVQADLVLDGHDEMAGEVRWRALDDKGWQAVPLRPLGNDRWAAEFTPLRVGRHEFVVSAWRDAWSTFTHELRKKHDAGVPVGVELMDGAALLRQAVARAGGKKALAGPAAVAARALHALGGIPEPAAPGQVLAAGQLPEATPERVGVLLQPELAQAMRALDERPFLASTPPYPLWVDRPQAEFASWYELFPRSMAPEPGRHGTFADVQRRLPALREMGFDVLYFPPIHPIGQRNRKGRNNSLKAEPGDVGSPYAIGAAQGGHDAVHPELGTLEDFERLLRAAREHDLEIALDFAIQCSPDHPWLREHPDWFSRRADGSIRYAENPPKKYEDIVNVEFYEPGGGHAPKQALWEALRAAVLFWVDRGVRIFRVDNPHTKPLPFWQWLIDTVQARHPDVLFLSEAFTRPKMMYRLAKIGFTQSYTYFTWRHGKQELTEYLLELSRRPPVDFFRPNFFVNTPDINPYFLQRSGRGGFLLRAALAATTSGLWGLYSGFELCEAAPVPGKEEYLDSEKYELRQRDWNQPGNINAQIARLNLIRRANPALQTHRGFAPVQCPNEQVLAFSKATSCGSNVVLVAISLDPHQPQHADLAVPRWRAGQGPQGVRAEELTGGQVQQWWGERHGCLLTPEQPYRIWRLSAL
ncbi:alpha-1,4-glucan--maltose-1-phosphate maltosyltransferase [Orrella sp. JC864]|uniref:alpha-1,4-glucan--maltose-1-phosphate maltosyltransferase n=1 Tax=Orrella sp. JC864 TaxID=3120298 RepID=UPI0030099ED9